MKIKITEDGLTCLTSKVTRISREDSDKIIYIQKVINTSKEINNLLRLSKDVRFL